jgi:hypothetical protein
MKKRNLAGMTAFNEEVARLHMLINQNPGQAIKEARAMSSDAQRGGLLLTGLKAGVLVDTGSCANDKQATEEGLALFRALSAKRPGRRGSSL